jgi:glycosyltransferase involved in cell wall biosynthesis
MKVLFVNPSSAAYGSEKSMLALLAAARNIEAEVVCHPGGSLRDDLCARGIKVHGLEFNKYALGRRPWWHLSLYRRFRHILAESKPDIVVINLGGNTPIVTLAALRAKIPVVRFSRFEFTPPKRWIDKFCWLKASAVICPSAHVHRQFNEWAPAHFRPRVHHWYDPYLGSPVSETQRRKVRDELGLGDAKTIGYVGRLHPHKRVETAILALAEIRRDAGDVRLLIVGGHDDSPSGASYGESLRQRVRELGLQDVVHFLGYREDVSAEMAACDVCVLPSQSESLGMVLMESWAQGVPTVASDVSGCREISLASGGGLLFPVGDHKALAGHIRNLLSDPATARRLGASGQAWVKTNCDPVVYAGRFQTLLQQLLCKHDR